jgi:hypothetical protein
MKKSFLLIILGIFLGTSVAIASTKVFSDIPADSWYTTAVNNLSEKGIINGYSDGTFQPANNINRAEVAVMLDKTINYVELKYKNEGLITAETANLIANADPKCLEEEDIPFEDANLYLHLIKDKFYWRWRGYDYFCEINAETGRVTDSYYLEH